VSSLTGRVFGYYHVLDRIGQGGMASVYRALDRKADREVAVKFISPALAQQDVFINRFRREVKAVAQLHHPHIVPVLDYGELHGYAYLVMPLLEVDTLLDHLKRGPVSLDLGARVIDQVSSALAHAHRHGIVHRDVKPSNILFDKDHNALLSDFGMAQYHDASVSLTGSGLIGTPAYMAPEQVRGGEVDARCDQYSLGVVLFYLATGSLPYTATSHVEYMLKHLNEPFPTARSRNPRVPEAVERVILKSTAKKPKHRFASVSEMNHALQAALAHLREPTRHAAPTIELPPAVPQPKVARRLRWRPLHVAAAVGAAVLLLLAIPVFASGLLSLLEIVSSPAEGSLIDPEAIQLTRQAGTIEAMSTELAGSQDDPLAIQTAIALTLGAPQAIAGAEDGVQPALAGQAEASSPTPTTTLGPGGGLAAASPTLPPQTSLPGGGPPGNSTTQSAPSSGTPSPTPPTGTITMTGTTPAGTSPTPTETGRPPSATPSPTLTPTPPPPSPTPTTPPPPPVTPTQDPCPLLDLGGFNRSGAEASWRFSNGSSTTVTIQRIVLDWPADNGALDRIRLGSSTIWNGSIDSPPADIDNLIGNRSLGSGSKVLKFEFTAQAGSGGYGLELLLSPGCQISAGG
jgi:tRNA A-37 threonylcarbamoyl transferase component Bud32